MHRIGLIGFGYWGPNIARSFQETRRARIDWICDQQEGALNQAAIRFPETRRTTEVTDLLGDPELTAVAIATPTSSHYALARQALLAGKHVLVEKPITAESGQALELLRLADERKLTLMVGHVFEYHATILALKQMIDAQEFGRIFYMNLERTNLGPVRTDVNALWDLASHDISICCRLLGSNPLSVSAIGRSFLNQEIEDVAFVVLTFDHGITARIHASWLDPLKTRRITVVGSRKMAIWNDLDFMAPITIFDKRVDEAKPPITNGSFLEHKTVVVDGGITIPKLRLNQPLQAECEHFLDCLDHGERPVSDGWSGFRVIRILEAATLSMNREGSQVAINLDP